MAEFGLSAGCRGLLAFSSPPPVSLPSGIGRRFCRRPDRPPDRSTIGRSCASAGSRSGRASSRLRGSCRPSAPWRPPVVGPGMACGGDCFADRRLARRPPRCPASPSTEWQPSSLRPRIGSARSSRPPCLVAAGRRADGARDRVVGQSVQLHGRQRRPRRNDAVCGFGRYAIAAAMAGAPMRVLRGACRGDMPFLAVNLPPARAFMGDVGRGAARISRGGFRHRRMAGKASWPGWFPLLVFLPFVMDATATLFRRTLLRRARVGGAPDALLPAASPAGRAASAALLRPTAV